MAEIIGFGTVYTRKLDKQSQSHQYILTVGALLFGTKIYAAFNWSRYNTWQCGYHL